MKLSRYNSANIPLWNEGVDDLLTTESCDCRFQFISGSPSTVTTYAYMASLFANRVRPSRLSDHYCV